MDASRKGNSLRPLSLFALLAGLIVGGLFSSSAWALDTYRWIDPVSGKWEYSPVPPEDPDQPYALIRDGHIIAEYEGSERLLRPESAYDADKEAAEAKAKADALLVVQFKQFDDIDTAMEAELDNLRYDYNLLDGTYDSLEKSLYGQIGVAADRQRASLRVPRHELEQIDSLRNNMQSNRAARAKLTEREASIRTEYQLKKERYREILQAQSER